MSTQLINHSPDLRHLKEDGYDVEVKGNGHLIVRHVPYVNAKKQIRLGVLVCPLTLAGDVTTKPGNHQVMFQGEFPCRKDGTPITTIGAPAGGATEVAPGIIINHTFSNRPAGGYKDYYEKMTTYISIISGPAEALDPKVTARINVFRESTDEESVFHYIDNAASTDGIAALNSRLSIEKVAIIGLGGCGSYVLDLVAKTPVKEIHLFDGEPFLQHNAFRSPGAASKSQLREIPAKVDYYAQTYGNMRRGVVSHNYYVDAENLNELRDFAFIFLCLDRGMAKKDIVERLVEWKVPFVDVGMDVQESAGCLGGILRLTSATTEKSGHARRCMAFADADPNDDYSKNVQIADLNALAASLAVIKWKKLFGFYRDLEHEHNSLYTIDVNMLINGEVYETIGS